MDQNPSEDLQPTDDNQPEPQAPALDDAATQFALEQLRSQQNLALGIAGGFAAAVVGAVLWATVTVLTGYQLGLMAIGVGFLVGFTVRALGKGLDQSFAIAGAALALLGCVLGNALIVVYWFAQSFEIGYFEALSQIDFTKIPQVMIETFEMMDLLFYGIAVYEGFKLSIRSVGPEELKAAVQGSASKTQAP